MATPKKYLATPSVGVVRAEDALIAWNAATPAEGEYRVCDVIVAPKFASRNPNVLAAGHYERCEEYQNTSGAAFVNWMFREEATDDRNAPLLSPEGVFGYMLAVGFADAHEQRNALVQFARLSSCKWAHAAFYGACIHQKEEDAIAAEAARRHRLIVEARCYLLRPDVWASIVAGDKGAFHA